MSPCAFTQSRVSPSCLRSASASFRFAFTARYPCERAMLHPTPSLEKQANVMPNKADTPMNSRMVVIEFEPLESTETPDVERWSDLKYLLSAIAPDIYDLFLTKERKLDKNALDDCASYLEQLTETKRDRGTNLWAQMLYAMLVLDFCFDVKRAEDIVEWVVRRAAGAKVMQTTRGGIGAAERFLVAFQKYRADKIENSRSVMGAATPENTIFWHNMRTSENVRSGPFKGQAMTSINVRSVCEVLTRINDEGRTFEYSEVNAALKSMSSIGWGTDHFVNQQKKWPITVMRTAENAPEGQISVGATQADLSGFGDVFYHTRCAKVPDSLLTTLQNKIDRPEAHAESLVVLWKDIEVGEGERAYNFFNAVTGADEDSIWYGYGILEHSENWKHYCGGLNRVDFHSVLEDVEIENLGFDEENPREVNDQFSISELTSFFSEKLPKREDLMQIVPPAYRYLPWALRFSGSERMDPWAPGRGDWACKLLVSERADEEARAQSPLPWERRNGGRADSEDEDSDQTGVSESCAESPDGVGSSPFGGLSANRSQDDSPIVKKARKSTAAPARRLAMVLDEADDDEAEDEDVEEMSEEVRKNLNNLPTPHTTHPISCTSPSFLHANPRFILSSRTEQVDDDVNSADLEAEEQMEEEWGYRSCPPVHANQEAHFYAYGFSQGADEAETGRTSAMDSTGAH